MHHWSFHQAFRDAECLNRSMDSLLKRESTEVLREWIRVRESPSQTSETVHIVAHRHMRGECWFWPCVKLVALSKGVSISIRPFRIETSYHGVGVYHSTVDQAELSVPPPDIRNF